MKKHIQLLLLVFSLAITSCEDVIDVTVQEAPSRLVIEASIDWEKGTTGNAQTIHISRSTPYFDTNSTTAVTGASVIITNDTSEAEYTFTDQNNGAYTTSNFVPVLAQSYTLRVVHNGEIYTANETLHPVPEISEIYQGIEDGFDDEILELHVAFMDPPEEGNNYFFKFQRNGDLLPELEVAYDEFVNGNEIDWWYEIEEDEDTDETEALVAGDVVSIEMYAISTAYKDYMEILINQVDGGDLFAVTPVAVKGNCINETNPDNYAHGFFRLTEVNKASYTIE